jgi:hypothetical protein
MYANKISEIGRREIEGFIGVFPLDKIPEHVGTPPKSFIVNTDTSNLEGKHWLAVSYETGGIIRVFDPLGFYYPQLLISKLHNLPNYHIIYNRKMFQNPLESTCGPHCLLFLKSRVNEYKHRKCLSMDVD